MSDDVLVEAKLLASSAQRKAEATCNQLPRFQYQVVKRGIDILLVAVSLPFCVPLGILLAFIVRCSSPGPIFYREYRLGQYGKPFCIWKFRSMYVKEEWPQRIQQAKHVGIEHNRLNKHPSDPRITPVGRLLRRLSLDEIPQLINVLKGEMALIGPRPIVDAERKLYGHGFHYYCMVRPGLSGLWQVSGRSRVSYEKRVLLDCQYVREWSLMLDAAIFIKTLHAVVTARGAC